MSKRVVSVNMLEEEKKIHYGADLYRLILLALLVFSFALLFGSGIVADLSANYSLKNVLMSLPGGPVAHEISFVLIAGLLIAVGTPRLWICGFAGASYGGIAGTVLSLASSMIGAALLYVLGRYFLTRMIEQRIHKSVTSNMNEKMACWGNRFRLNGFWWVLYGRLMPVSNATVNSLICGYCKVAPGDYLLGSLIGFIPLTLVFTSFGSGGSSGNFSQILLGFALLGGAMLVRVLVSRFLAPLKK